MKTLALVALLHWLSVPLEDEDAAAKEKWDVNNPPGPSVEASIDTDEGTWMNLDLSPDGRTIVFDLLGDLYTLPAEGGEATRIAAGIAWEMQPRFSPDGQQIAFTSDAGGGDNLWVMNRDGSERRQVTKERFRLLSTPAWTPDGAFLAGRKHFTSHRSLGAGEVWLFHATGGDGLQMTKRRTEQKDEGEPAFSPDGRYLYFSVDSTPGETFDYSKDSNGQIYTIQRLDRESGEIDTLVRGPGGAARPTPSPDGETLAFVRRVRFQTTLCLLDIASGRVRQLHDGLERDMQETWAIHGVYPTMAWTPDNASLLFYAKGGIHRVDVNSGEVKPIPFHVKDERTVQEAVRVQVPVAPDQFKVRALRWVRVAPDGQRVIYQALGHIWVRDLPAGEPRRLTAQTEHFEFHPAFSRDGRFIVYTTWHDRELGSIRVVATNGGEGRTITSEPGHYVDPVFSPSGETVVFGRISGGRLTSPLWSRETGIFRIPTAGGEAIRITRKGTRPQFGGEEDRIYLITSSVQDGQDKSSLFSIGLDGSEERTHLNAANATRFAVAPDEKHVAWVERFHAYVAPLVHTGREVKLGPEDKAIPQHRLTRDAGENLQWSGDGKTVYWSLGPELFQRSVDEAFAHLGQEEGKAAEPVSEGIDISFTARQEQPSGSLVLSGATLVTMNGDEVIEDGVVLVEGNRIRAVGRKGEVEIPSGARGIDVDGMTIVPGFIDVHAHGGQAISGLTPQQNWQHHANLAFGVTTIHDPSHHTNSIFAVSEMARSGRVLSPRTFSTGTILYGAAGNSRAEVDSLDDARSHLRRLAAVGAFSVKSYNQPRRDQRQQVIQAGRELGVMVVPEGGSTLAHNLTMIVDGHTGIEHSLPVEKVYRDVTQMWSATEVGYTPTLVVGYGGIWGENYWYDVSNVWENERLMSFAPRFVVDPRSRRRTRAPEEEYNTHRSAGICKALVDAGGRCQLGAHGQLAGLGAHWELWMLQMGGLSNHQALRAATLDGAYYVGLDAELGSLEAGKLADLLVLEADPLENIRNSERIRYTMLNGRLYDARTLAPADGRDGAAPTYFFQGDDGIYPMETRTAGCGGCTTVGHGGSEELERYR